jgi:hypothetical protein
MFRKILLNLGLGWLGKQIRASAEGKHGPGPQKAYLLLKGKKTVAGLVLLFLCAVLAGAGYPAGAAGVGSVGAVFVSGGLMDKDWRKGVPDDVKAWRWYRFALDRSSEIAAAMAFLMTAVATCDAETVALLAHVWLTCKTAGAALAGLSLGLVQAGLMADVRLAAPPRVAVTPQR